VAAFATIQTQVQHGVMTITLNRPDALNTLNEPMSVELGTALRVAQRDDDVRCVVLTGAGRAFCAGQDLNELNAARSPGTVGPPTDVGAVLRQRYNPLVVRIRTMEKPVVAAVNGVAAGGGLSLALAADLRLCARSATFVIAFLRIGLVPDMAATLTLVQHLGYARAAALCLLGDPLTADEALRCGLVSRVADETDLPSVTRQMAEDLARAPTQAVGLTKRALNHAWAATLEEQLEYEAFLQTTASQAPDHREGVQAFLAKRKPRFSGR